MAMIRACMIGYDKMYWYVSIPNLQLDGEGVALSERAYPSVN